MNRAVKQERGKLVEIGVVRAYSDDAGHFVKPPRYLKQNAKTLRRLQRKLA